MTDQPAAEIDLGVAEAGEIGAKRLGRFAREHGSGALDDTADCGVQRAVIALEQLETGREAWLHARRNSGK